MSFHRLVRPALFLSTCLWISQAFAEERPVCPVASDRACIARSILFDMNSVQEMQWKDASLRDLAGTLTYDGKVDQAIALIDQITNQDTQAMTIRMIGMNTALYSKQTPSVLKTIYAKLAARAAKMTNMDAQAIAVTYIAMSQAFAGLDEDADKTAAAMTNIALQQKAYGETAEIQADRGDTALAMKSISKIITASVRNKSYETVAGIFMKKGDYDGALKCANLIDNPMKRAQVLESILHAQEVATRGARNDTHGAESGEQPAPIGSDGMPGASLQ